MSASITFIWNKHVILYLQNYMSDEKFLEIKMPKAVDKRFIGNTSTQCDKYMNIVVDFILILKKEVRNDFSH